MVSTGISTGITTRPGLWLAFLLPLALATGAPATEVGAAGSCPATVTPRVLIAGDSWAQYMWDDGSHNELFDKFGHGDKSAISRSLDANPGPGHSGPEYAVSGSEAREWVDAANFPWISNMVADLTVHPSVDTVVLSIGGNDILAARSEGGWYKDMDLDNPGSEAALFSTIEANTTAIADAALAVSPDLEILLSSYEYPNFNVSILWCWVYACPKRDDLSRDPVGDLITDQELNAMMLMVEEQRIGWTNEQPRWLFDNSIGLMHHYYGDGTSPPGALPKPGTEAPDYLPFPAGNPLLPALRENFRAPGGIPADPIHLDFDGYQYKIAQQLEGSLFAKFRGAPSATFFSQGGTEDGWTDGSATGTEAIRIGDTGAQPYAGLVSFDTAAIPDGAEVTAASLYLLRDSATGDNPFLSGDLGTPRVDVARGSFGAPEVEASDATASADATNAGCFVGSAGDEFYAIRIDLTADGLAAINDSGLTQLRLSFPTTDTGEDRIGFFTGDATLLTGDQRIRVETRWVERQQPDGSLETIPQTLGSLVHQGLGEIIGTPAPFLDVTYVEFVPEIFADGFESGDTSAWTASVP
ncbi:MAG: hypothetical protein K0U98_02940 [Deltaproteobacteria bacterium]|nr:hypothetical protein [Deltaproteobacteria bacterium]